MTTKDQKTDIVWGLRQLALKRMTFFPDMCPVPAEILIMAAEEIERLRANAVIRSTMATFKEIIV